MRVAIAGAGAVGRSIARELIDNGHEVLLIDKDADSIKPERVPNAEWLLADSCELSSLEEARLQHCDVVIAATGDDKANLVTSLLAKTEFGVPRTVRRGNANLVEMTLPEDSPYVGKPTGLIPWPDNCALVTILRDGQVYTPDADQPLESGDELLFVVSADVEEELENMLAPTAHPNKS